MATQLDFSIDRSAVNSLSFTYTDSSGSGIDLTNYCVRICIQSNAGESYNKTFLSGTANSSYSLSGNSSGVITFIVSASEAAAMVFDSATYDLDVKAPNEAYTGSGPNIIRLYQGFITPIARLTVNPDDFNCPTPTDPCLTC
jgi:hypothetical protein